MGGLEQVGCTVDGGLDPGAVAGGDPRHHGAEPDLVDPGQRDVAAAGRVGDLRGVCCGVGLDHLGLGQRDHPAWGLGADRVGDGSVHQSDPIRGQLPGQGGDLAGHPHVAPQVHDPPPHQGQPVLQIQHVGHRMLGRDPSGLPRDRQLAEAELLDLRCALTADVDQPVAEGLPSLAARATPRDRRRAGSPSVRRPTGPGRRPPAARGRHRSPRPGWPPRRGRPGGRVPYGHGIEQVFERQGLRRTVGDGFEARCRPGGEQAGVRAGDMGGERGHQGDRLVAPEGKQSDGTGADQTKGVEVLLAALPAPVQAGAGRAVRAGRLEGADHRAPGDRHAAVDGRRHGLVRRARVAVVDDDHATAGEHAGEGDRPGERGVHGLAGAPEQVDPAVAGPPDDLGRVEPAHHLRLGLEGPDADRVARCRHRPVGAAEQAEQHREGEQTAEEWHGARVPGGGDGGAVPADGLWIRRTAARPVDGKRAREGLRSIGGSWDASRTLTEAAPPGADFARPQTTTAPDVPWGSVSIVGEAPRYRPATAGSDLAQASGRPAPAGRRN